MQILIIPGTLDARSTWSHAIALLEDNGFRVTLLEYKTPKTDDIEDQINLAETFLVEKTLIVGEGVGGRITVQLLVRNNPYVCGAVLFATPSLLYTSLFTKVQKFVAFFLLPIRLVLPYKLKEKISNAILRLRYRSPEYFQYRKSIDSAQDTLLPIISTYIKLVWGTKKLRVPRSVAIRMNTILEDSDFIEVDRTAEPIHKNAPRVFCEIVTGVANTH